MIPAIILPSVAFVAIRAYAAHSYLYYDLDESLISDHDFDYLCVWLLKNYAIVKPHDINDYLNKEMLEAGTGFHLSNGKVCGLTRQWADDLLAEYKKKRPKKKVKPVPVTDALDFLD